LLQPVRHGTLRAANAGKSVTLPSHTTETVNMQCTAYLQVILTKST